VYLLILTEKNGNHYYSSQGKVRNNRSDNPKAHINNSYSANINNYSNFNKQKVSKFTTSDFNLNKGNFEGKQIHKILSEGNTNKEEFILEIYV
jgi:hypothetical protein